MDQTKILGNVLYFLCCLIKLILLSSYKEKTCYSKLNVIKNELKHTICIKLKDTTTYGNPMVIIMGDFNTQFFTYGYNHLISWGKGNGNRYFIQFFYFLFEFLKNTTEKMPLKMSLERVNVKQGNKFKVALLKKMLQKLMPEITKIMLIYNLINSKSHC